MKERVIIVEDDSIIAHSLSLLLKQNNYGVINTVNNAVDAMSLCIRHLPDFILLDINLKGEENGIWLAENIKNKKLNIEIIYLTALSDKHTIESLMETGPILYINKPYINEVLISNIDLALSNVGYYNKKINVKDGGKSIHLPLKDVICIQSDGNYINVKFEDGSQIVVREKLSIIETKILSILNWYTRIHQSYLVNDRFIKVVEKDFVQMINQQIPISRKYKSKVHEKFMQKGNL